MALVALAAVTAVVHIVLLMTVATLVCLACKVGQFLLVAGFALQVLVSAIKGEVRFLVIKLPVLPGHGVVAVAALLAEALLVGAVG